MHYKVSMDLQFCLSEEQFSLDILVQKLSELFMQKAFVNILQLLLTLIQEVLVLRMLNGKSSCNCGAAKWQLNGDFNRRIRTSLGDLHMSFVRMKCAACGKNFAPLQRLLKLGRYQTKTNELEKLVAETVCETSYRRGSAQLLRDRNLKLSFRTANDWILRTNCDEIVLPEEKMKQPMQIMPDGTGFKGAGVNGQACHGDLKVVIGVTQTGEIVPMGTWAGMSWAEIHENWKERKVAFAPGSIVVCDGELGLSEGFAQYAEEQQRCQWHVNRDLYHAMRQNGAGVREVRPVQKRLAGALAIELPADDFEKVSEADKATLVTRMEDAEQKVSVLIGDLEGRGYEKAAGYLRRAKAGMFGYIRRWLKWGLVSPKASSMIERVMRELGRRIKNIAYNWSERGVTKIARIILKRFANRKEWNNYWEKLYGDDLSVIILLRNLKGSQGSCI